MTAIGTTVFTNSEDYQAGIGATDLDLDLVLTGKGDFKASLTWVKLPYLHLFRGRENVQRIWYTSLSPVRTCDMRLRRLNLVRAELRRADPITRSVAHYQIARRYCFSELGRLARTYRGLFGESPSATLGST